MLIKNLLIEYLGLPRTESYNIYSNDNGFAELDHYLINGINIVVTMDVLGDKLKFVMFAYLTNRHPQTNELSMATNSFATCNHSILTTDPDGPNIIKNKFDIFIQLATSYKSSWS